MSNLLEPCLYQIMVERREIADPVVQVVEIKEQPKKEGQTGTRYKLAINDGTNYCPALINSKLNHLIESGELAQFKFIKIGRYNVPTTNSRQVFIILELTVLPQTADDVIGSPEALSSSKPQQAAAPQMNQAPPPQSRAAAAPPPAPKPQPKAAAPPAKPKPMRPPTTGNFINISSLTMYINSWTILARVVQKSQKKNWTNNRGSGSLFSVTLKDKAGDEIRGTFFNEEAEKFYEEIEINHIYEITGGRIKAANTKFNNVNNMYEISFDKTTTFKEAAEDDSIGELTYDYVKLKDIADLEVNKIVDIIAICSQVDDCTQIHSNKTGKDLTKRTIYLVDDTNIKIECTLWNDEAINIPSTILNQVISIKEAKIGEFHGKNLGTTSSSILTIDPQVPEAQKLLSWWDSNKDNLGNFSSLSGEGGEYSGSTRMIYLEQINNGMGTGQKPDYFQCYASLQEIVTSRKLYYLACPNPSCKNKGVKSSDGSTYFCESCKQTIENPIPRYACTAKFNDFSGSSYFSLLGEDVGQAIIGMTAPEWRDLTDNVDEKEVRSIVQKNFFNFFKLKARAKEEYYNDESRVKLTVVSASKIDFGDAALFFAKEIQKFSQ